MKTLQQWFDEYAVSHQNETNISIHYICVPAIFFSIVGIFMSIPSQFLSNLLQLNNPFIENWATVALLLVLLFYLRLSFSMFLKMLIFSILCIVGNFYLGKHVPLLYTSIAIFVIAWIGQFYGHKVEGAKPSFIKDLQFLLIGPAWVIKKMFS
ncbi:Mpo1-like protein [uncultured Tenacibaculum sp.]|uniref:Mpo1 family 2-hydroxy fatty acid dioxygenase n=1 Tax=uncultured Tenacibaculum sp. TaxID=174713 RepID=UPI002624C0AB|nr:Mpo1-like protein [uncultured Tenacibaculum sp.]